MLSPRALRECRRGDWKVVVSEYVSSAPLSRRRCECSRDYFNAASIVPDDNVVHDDLCRCAGLAARLPSCQAAFRRGVEASGPSGTGRWSQPRGPTEHRRGSSVPEGARRGPLWAAKLVVVAAEKPASEAPIVKDPKEREHKRGAGVLALWCTLAALGTGNAVTTADAIARLAIVSTSQFRYSSVLMSRTWRRAFEQKRP